MLMQKTTLTPDDVKQLRSLPVSERQRLLTHISRTNDRLAAQILTELEQDQYTTQEVREVASFFDISVKTVDTWIRKGMPYISKGRTKKGWYDLREIARWVAAQRAGISVDDADKEQADAAYREEKTRMARLQREKLEGKLVDIEEYNEKLMQTVGMIRKGIEQFRRTFGNDAVEMLTGTIDEVEERLFSE